MDRYSDTGLDDEDQEELSAVQRRQAERRMAQRDRMERTGRRGERASRRNRPSFLGSDDDMDDEDRFANDLGVGRMRRRTRRQYDERRDMDDLEGVGDVSARSDDAYMLTTSRNYLWSN